MTDVNRRLIADLAALAGKYNATDWQALADWLDNDAKRAQLRLLLEELARANRQSKSKSRVKTPRTRGPSRASRLRTSLAELRVTDEARGIALEDIWLKLRERELLPTLAEVRSFAVAAGLKGLNAPRRDDAVVELMERLVELPSGDLEARMRSTVAKERDLGQEYGEWVRLILGERPTG